MAMAHHLRTRHLLTLSTSSFDEEDHENQKHHSTTAHKTTTILHIQQLLANSQARVKELEALLSKPSQLDDDSLSPSPSEGEGEDIFQTIFLDEYSIYFAYRYFRFLLDNIKGFRITRHNLACVSHISYFSLLRFKGSLLDLGLC